MAVILIIDDEPISQALIASLVDSMGHIAYMANSIAEGLVLAHEQAVHGIYLGVAEAEKGVAESIAVLAKLPSSPKIVVLSPRDFPLETLEKAKHAIWKNLTKPLSKQLLTASLDELFIGTQLDSAADVPAADALEFLFFSEEEAALEDARQQDLELAGTQLAARRAGAPEGMTTLEQDDSSVVELPVVKRPHTPLVVETVQGVQPERVHEVRVRDVPAKRPTVAQASAVRKMSTPVDGAVPAVNPDKAPYDTPKEAQTKAPETTTQTGPIVNPPALPLLDTNSLPSLKDYKQTAEQDYIKHIMLRCNNDARKAATMAGISRGHMYLLLKKYADANGT